MGNRTACQRASATRSGRAAAGPNNASPSLTAPTTSPTAPPSLLPTLLWLRGRLEEHGKTMTRRSSLASANRVNERQVLRERSLRKSELLIRRNVPEGTLPQRSYRHARGHRAGPVTRRQGLLREHSTSPTPPRFVVAGDFDHAKIKRWSPASSARSPRAGNGAQGAAPRQLDTVLARPPTTMTAPQGLLCLSQPGQVRRRRRRDDILGASASQGQSAGLQAPRDGREAGQRRRRVPEQRPIQSVFRLDTHHQPDATWTRSRRSGMKRSDGVLSGGDQRQGTRPNERRPSNSENSRSSSPSATRPKNTQALNESSSTSAPPDG